MRKGINTLVITYLKQLFANLDIRGVNFENLNLIGKSSLLFLIEDIKGLMNDYKNPASMTSPFSFFENNFRKRVVIPELRENEELKKLSELMSKKASWYLAETVKRLTDVKGFLENELLVAEDLPTLPTIRDYVYFAEGTAVMFYTGSGDSRKMYGREKIIPYQWAAGVSFGANRDKLDPRIYVYSRVPLYKEEQKDSSLFGHIIRIDAIESPVIFNRSDFFLAKKILNEGGENDMGIFFSNCKKQPDGQLGQSLWWNDKEEVIKMIIDEPVESVSDEEIKEEKEENLIKMFEITQECGYFTNSAEVILKSRGIEVPK